MTNSNLIKLVSFLGQERRRRWSPEQKLAMVREEPRTGTKHFGRGSAPAASMPTSCSCGARSSIRTAACRRSRCWVKPWCRPTLKLTMHSNESVNCNGCWAKKTTEAEILKEAVEDRPVAKMDCALTLVARGRPVKLVAMYLGGALAINGSGGNQAIGIAQSTAKQACERCKSWSLKSKGQRAAWLWIPSRLGTPSCVKSGRCPRST